MLMSSIKFFPDLNNYLTIKAFIDKNHYKVEYSVYQLILSLYQLSFFCIKTCLILVQRKLIKQNKSQFEIDHFVK